MAGILSSEPFNTTVSFFDWFKLGLPFSFVLFLASYFLLVKIIFPNKLGKFEMGTQLINKELEDLGPWKVEEKRVFFVFVFTALMWIFQQPLSDLLPLGKSQLTDVGIGMTSALLMFLIPSKNEKGSFLLTWKDTERLPWGVLLMFGGGLALSEAFKESGLITLITQQMSGMDQSNLFLFVTILCLVGLILTALMSNLAMVNI
jgi:sodium-dependent dicarboxylate transporter 2/3/5